MRAYPERDLPQALHAGVYPYSYGINRCQTVAEQLDIDKCLTLNPPTLLQVREVGGASVRISILKGPGEGLKIRQAQRPKEACSLGLGENFRASESRSQACLDYAERSRKSQRKSHF